MRTTSRSERTIFQYIDKPLVGLYILLTLIGWVAVYSAVYNEAHQSMFDLSQNYGKQMLWIGTSYLIMAVLLALDFRIFEGISPFVYIGALALGIGVALFGREVNGAKAWFEIGSFRLQPAEFMKFATCMMVAYYFSNTDVSIQKNKTKLAIAAIILLPIAIIILQKDTGSALVYFSFIFVLYREGLPIAYLLYIGLTILIVVLTLLLNEWAVAVGIVSVATLYILLSRKIKPAILKAILVAVPAIIIVFSVDYAFDNILQEHQRQRINVLLGKVEDFRGAGYNVHQSLIAIGSGGFWGKGFLQGTQTKFDFVPEQSTDFIFCTIGEEYGFIGSFLLLLLFSVLLIRILMVAERQSSRFARVYGYGVASVLFFHVFVNIGMTIGLLPVIGIPLPFISYGGSSLWSFTILLGILIRLDSGRKISLR
ncbi:MAG: rod shape-determining protein RodA [Sphingobacteriaceae bacterium]|nr:rod shape-determining protein RodA [Sphingobacteriaceae bacterium]